MKNKVQDLLLLGLGFVVLKFLEFVLEFSFLSTVITFGEYAVILGAIFVILKGNDYLQQIFVTLTLVIVTYEFFINLAFLRDSTLFVIGGLFVGFALAGFTFIASGVLLKKTVKKFDLPIEFY